MSEDLDLHDVAADLHVSIGLFIWRLRQVEIDGDLSFPQMSALARLERSGPTSPGDLARAERISPQGMGMTLGALEELGYVERRADPGDGRRILMSVTRSGNAELRKRRGTRTDRLAEALSSGFTATEIKRLRAAAPLIERLADAVNAQ